MFFPESRIRVFLYGQPADMRKSYDGLYALARQSFDADPLAGHLFVFANRRDTRDGEIDCIALKLMLEGIEAGRQFKRYRANSAG